LKVLATVIACLLPVVGIVVLYVIPYTSTRIGIIAAFVTIFSFTLNLTTSAHMKDIFAATAALVPLMTPGHLSSITDRTHRFAAVLVVFVGTTASIDPACNCAARNP